MSVLWGYKPPQFYPSGCRFSRKMWVEAIGENKQTPVNRLESIDQRGQIPVSSLDKRISLDPETRRNLDASGTNTTLCAPPRAHSL